MSVSRRRFLTVVAGAFACQTCVHPQAETHGLFDGVRKRAEWAKRREILLSNMQLVMGPLPRQERTPLSIIELERVELPRFTRSRITFLSEGEDRVPAYLLVPRGLNKPSPGLICLHQTTSTGKSEPAGLQGDPNLFYARELAERGYITLAPDYPGFGDNHTDPYQHGYASGTMKGIWNHIRAVDVLQSVPAVARNRIGSIGHSLGGHNTLFAAVFDPRIKAMVTSCGFNSFRKYNGGDITGWSSKKYMPLIAEKYGKDPERVPFDFPDILAALAPRPLFINAPLRDSNFEVSGVKDCVEAALPVYKEVFHAAERLVAVYPDAGHQFPVDIRHAAYGFLDRWLK